VFPFLIGTVRTDLLMFSKLTTSMVSIPHRYGKNSLDRFTHDLALDVSIPHRYGKNHSFFAYKFRRSWFPFLIGTVRTEKM